MTNKPRLLIYGDCGQPTGFEKITNGLASNLMDRYEILVAGIGYFGQKQYPFRVLPASLSPATDFSGINYFDNFLNDFQPDVILFIQDIWNILPFLLKKPLDIPCVIYTLPDSPNIKWIYGLGLGMVSEVVTPTHFGARELAASVQQAIQEINPVIADHSERYGVVNHTQGNKSLTARLDRLARFQNTTEINVVPLGLSEIPSILLTSEPSLLDEDSKNICRDYFHIPQESFVILNVNTNSWRKRIDLTLVAFKRVMDKIPNSLLVLNCQGDQSHGWDIKQLMRLLEIPSDRVRLIHDDYPILTEEQLWMLYTTADVQVNTSSGEGWGLPAVEGAQCGVFQLVPYWSATEEIWEPINMLGAHPCNFHYSNVNTLHCLISVEHLVIALIASSTTELKGKVPPNLVSWYETSRIFDTIIAKALAESKSPIELSMNEVNENRDRRIVSAAYALAMRM